MRRVVSFVAFAVVLAVAAAACADTASNDAAAPIAEPAIDLPPSPVTNADASPTAPAPAEEPVPVADTAGGVPPFDAVLLELLGTTDVPAYLVEVERAASELTAECMRSAGFVFELPIERPARPSGPHTETREYAEAEGFGLVTGFRQAIVAALDSTGDIDQTNRAYLESLTAAELDSFFVALNGQPAEPGQIATEAGCAGHGSDQAYADWLRFLAALPQYTAIGEERDTHPDWLAALGQWQECMAARGYEYDDPAAIRTDVATRMESLMTGDSDRVVIFTDDGVDLGPEIEMLFDEMLAFEIDAAVANFECNEPLTDVFDRVEREVQQGFVDRNRAVIDELLAAN